jgi:hypothetical protein
VIVIESVESEVSEMSIADEKLPLPHCDVRKEAHK